MIAVAIRPIAGDRGEGIAPVIGIAIGGLGADRVEAAAIDAQFNARRAASGRGDGIDRAAQRRSAQPQRIAATIDLQMLENLRVEFLKVAIIVGQVDRNAILQQGQAAHVEAARQARTTDRDANLLPEARLGIDAGREGERVAQGDGQLILKIVGGHDIDAARCALDAGGGFLGKRAGGDDDAALVGGFVGEGSGSRQGKGDGAQRNAARGVGDTHEF